LIHWHDTTRQIIFENGAYQHIKQIIRQEEGIKQLDRSAVSNFDNGIIPIKQNPTHYKYIFYNVILLYLFLWYDDDDDYTTQKKMKHYDSILTIIQTIQQLAHSSSSDTAMELQ